MARYEHQVSQIHRKHFSKQQLATYKRDLIASGAATRYCRLESRQINGGYVAMLIAPSAAVARKIGME